MLLLLLLASAELVVVLVTAAPSSRHPASYIYVAKTSLEFNSFVQKWRRAVGGAELVTHPGHARQSQVSWSH